MCIALFIYNFVYFEEQHVFNLGGGGRLRGRRCEPEADEVLETAAAAEAEGGARGGLGGTAGHGQEGRHLPKGAIRTLISLLGRL